MKPKQRRFVEEYLKDLNATQAAIRAGYSAKTAEQQGPRLLGNAGVAAAIHAAQAKRSARTEVTQDYVLRNLCEVLERTMQRAPVMAHVGRGQMAQATDDEGRHVWTFDARGAVAALTLLGKHLAMFVERHELAGKDGQPLLTLEAVDTVLAAMRAERSGNGQTPEDKAKWH